MKSYFYIKANKTFHWQQRGCQDNSLLIVTESTNFEGK